MKVLVTGGAGFIGSHTVEALLETGADVRILDNFSSGKRQNLPTHPKLDICVGDIRHRQNVAEAMKDRSHVLHLAAQVSVQASIDDPETSCGHNIQGFVNVISAARMFGIKRLVYASSAAVYGIPEQVPVAETDPLQPIAPYGLEKYVNEQYALLFHSLFGFNSLGLRYFNVYGPRQDPASPYAGVISKFLECVQKRQPLVIFGDGKQTRDFIYVKDIARANVQALQSNVGGVCNVGTGKSTTLLEVVEALSACAKRQLQVQHQPQRTGDIVHSCAVVQQIHERLGFVANCSLIDGLRMLAGDFGVAVA